jgi:hypothetical protein
VGDIFVCSWGYDQTNIDYYKVMEVKNKSVVIAGIGQERDESVKMEFHVGGFSAHCSNQRDQKWIIKSNPSNPVIRIRLGKKGWTGKFGRYILDDEPVKFYDYNF